MFYRRVYKFAILLLDMLAKNWLFIMGIVVLVVSAVGLTIALGFVPGFLSALPGNLAIYLGIDVILGIAMIVMSISPRTY